MHDLLTDRRRRVIRADGRVEQLPKPLSMEEILKVLNTDTVDSVNLRHMGSPLMVMVVIDKAWDCISTTEEGSVAGMPAKVETRVPLAPKFPINEKATELYLANCRPGTTHRIAGDVVICPDSDFGGVM